MQHLDYNVDVAIARLKNIIATKKEFKRGVYNDGVDILKTGFVTNSSITRCNDDTLYTETGSMINLVIEYSTSRTNMLNLPETYKGKLDLVILPALKDNKFPEMMEIKLFGTKGKPSAVSIDRDTGNVYMLYIVEGGNDTELLLLQFAQLNSVDKEFILADSSAVITYEFGIKRDALYAFVSREYGWANLRDNLFIRFNTNPFVRVFIGEDGTDKND